MALGERNRQCGKESMGGEEADGSVGKAGRWMPKANFPFHNFTRKFYQFLASLGTTYYFLNLDNSMLLIMKMINNNKRQYLSSVYYKTTSVLRVCVCMCMLSCAWLFAIPWTVAPPRLLCPWDFPGKNTGVGCHFLLQGIFLTQGSKPGSPLQADSLYLSHVSVLLLFFLQQSISLHFQNWIRSFKSHSKKNCF